MRDVIHVQPLTWFPKSSDLVPALNVLHQQLSNYSFSPVSMLEWGENCQKFYCWKKVKVNEKIKGHQENVIKFEGET